jgi:hypothetical protein
MITQILATLAAGIFAGVRNPSEPHLLRKDQNSVFPTLTERDEIAVSASYCKER